MAHPFLAACVSGESEQRFLHIYWVVLVHRRRLHRGVVLAQVAHATGMQHHA